MDWKNNYHILHKLDIQTKPIRDIEKKNHQLMPNESILFHKKTPRRNKATNKLLKRSRQIKKRTNTI